MWEFVLTPWASPGGQFRPILALKNGVFLIIFIIILRFIWDLGLLSFDSPKVVVSGKILVFGYIFSFLGLNWAQKWTKTENFGYVPFVLKHRISKHCSYTVFLLWWTTSGPNFNKFEPYMGEKGPRNPQKGPISWLLHCHKNIWKFITLEPQILCWWNLPGLCITKRSFIWQKFGALPIGRRRAWLKNLWKKAKKLFFWLHFLEIPEPYQKRCHMWHFVLHCITGPNFKRIRHHLGELYARNHPKAA